MDIDGSRVRPHANWPADSPQHTVTGSKLCAMRV